MSSKPGRNDPCPCGSGKKFKHCHGLIGSVVQSRLPVEAYIVQAMPEMQSLAAQIPDQGRFEIQQTPDGDLALTAFDTDGKELFSKTERPGFILSVADFWFLRVTKGGDAG